MAKKGGALSYLAPILGSALGEQFLPGLGSKMGFDFSPSMGGAIGGALGGGATGGLKGAALGGLGGYAEGGFLGNHGDLNGAFGSLFGHGQGGAGEYGPGTTITGNVGGTGGGTGGSGIVAGSPSAMPSMSAQSTPSFMGPDAGLTTAGSAGGGSSSGGGGAAGGGGLSVGLDTNILSHSAGGSGGAGGMGGMSPSLQKYLLPSLLLGGSLLKANQTPPEMKQLQALAQSQADQAKMLQPQITAEQQGKLPGGADTYIQQATESAKARIRDRYAQMGMQGSTAESQDLANADNAAVSMRFQIGQQLAQGGLAQLQSSNAGAAALYQAILAQEQQQGGDMAGALAEFGSRFVQPGR